MRVTPSAREALLRARAASRRRRPRPATRWAMVTSSSFATSDAARRRDRVADDARADGFASTCVLRVGEPHEADLGPREKQVERARRARRRRRRRSGRPTRDSARRRRGTRRAAHAHRARARSCARSHRRAAHRRATVASCRRSQRRAARARADLAGTRAGRCVARSTHTWTKRPVAAGSSSPCAEQPDLVDDRRRAELASRAGPHRSTSGNDSGRSNRHDVSTTKPTTGSLRDVEAALADQMLVHHGVEVRVVGDVVDVAVRVVVHPARRDREEVRDSRARRIASPSRRRSVIDRRRGSRRASARRAARSSAAPASRVPAGEVRQAADVRGHDHVRPLGFERASACCRRSCFASSGCRIE